MLIAGRMENWWPKYWRKTEECRVPPASDGVLVKAEWGPIFRGQGPASCQGALLHNWSRIYGVPSMFRSISDSIRGEGLAWQVRSSSRRKPARPKTSAPPSVLVTEKSCRLRATCSISSNRRMLPAWKHWSPILRRPEALYGTRPARGGNKIAKLKAIREALRTVKRVWLATDCDREGQLVGQDILEHYKYRGEVMRVLFTAQDLQTIRDAFGRAKPNAEYSRLYAAAVARRQADQIYNLSLTGTATVILGRGRRRVVGVGRAKTPTLAIVCASASWKSGTLCQQSILKLSPLRASREANSGCGSRLRTDCEARDCGDRRQGNSRAQGPAHPRPVKAVALIARRLYSSAAGCLRANPGS
jgi:hypothetical protein